MFNCSDATGQKEILRLEKDTSKDSATMSLSSLKEMVQGIDAPVVNVLALIGGLVLVRSALCVLTALYTTFLRPGKNLKKYGAWAVVTGATGEREAACCIRWKV